jgi:hypothetical protein
MHGPMKVYVYVYICVYIYIYIALVIQHTVRMRHVTLSSILTFLGSVSDSRTQKTEFKLRANCAVSLFVFVTLILFSYLLI